MRWAIDKADHPVAKADADHDQKVIGLPAIARQEIVLAVKAKATVHSAHQQRNKLRSQRMA